MTTKRTALITGASGGIGYELSKLFATEGYDLVLVARSEQKLDQLAEELHSAHAIDALVLPKDLSNPVAPQEIYDTSQSRSLTIDVLVNNAGFSNYGPFLETDLAGELDMLQVNLVALTHLTKLFLPGMVERGQGRILNIGSTASFQPTPLVAVYGASKSYVLHFTEAIAEELAGTGVTVTALCPGATRTGFQARAGVGQARLANSGLMSAEQVARIGYRALMRGRRVVVPGLYNSLMAFLVRFTPRPVVTRASYRMMMPKQ
jgi:short-subunit dehydrogenase